MASSNSLGYTYEFRASVESWLSLCKKNRYKLYIIGISKDSFLLIKYSKIYNLYRPIRNENPTCSIDSKKFTNKIDALNFYNLWSSQKTLLLKKCYMFIVQYSVVSSLFN